LESTSKEARGQSLGHPYRVRTTSTPKRKASKRNVVLWEYYILKEDSSEKWPRAICSECGKAVKRKDSSTTGMKLHLKRNHRKLFKEYECKFEEANLKEVSILRLSTCLVKTFHFMFSFKFF
jgi:BED zinc finger